MGGGSKGGGGSSQFSFGSSSTQLPDWLNNASQQAITQAQTLATQPYDPYTGQLVAGTTADTSQAYQQVRDMQGMGMPAYGADINAYQGLLSQVNPISADQIQALTNQLYGNYTGNVVAPAAGLLAPYLSQGPATAAGVGANALQLMSPYSAAVMDPAIALGKQQLAQNLQTIGAGANQAGAFGGTRQGVLEGTAQAQTALGLANQYGQMLQSGWNTALTPATNIALQGGQEGYGASGTLASLLSGGYGAAQTAGQTMANTNLQAGLTAAQQLPAALTAQQTAAQQQASLLQTIGAAQTQQQQAELNAQYGQFLTQQQYPYQSLDTLLAAVGSVPYGTTSSWQSYGQQQQQQQRNMAAGILGGAAQGAAIGSMIPGVGTAIGAGVGGILGAL